MSLIQFLIEEALKVVDRELQAYRKELKVGFYDSIGYPVNHPAKVGIAIESSDYIFSIKNAQYRIFEFVKNKKGIIESIAIDFDIETDDGLLFKGDVIYNSGKVRQIESSNASNSQFETTFESSNSENAPWGLKFDDFPNNSTPDFLDSFFQST